MSKYTETFYADTPEEARRLAVEHQKKLDFMRQPYVYGPYETNPTHNKPRWYATVQYWGLD